MNIDPSLLEGKHPKKDAIASAPLDGLSGVVAPKIVVHGQNKINDKKVWSKETWAKNSYLF